MTYRPYKLILLVLPLVLAAVSVDAFVSPTAALPVNSPVVVVNIEGWNQTKSGGLGVDAFVVQDRTILRGNTIFIKNTIRGGVGATFGDSTVYFGSDADNAIVSLDVQENVQVTNPATRLIQESAQGTSERLLCADGDGVVILCP